MKKLLFLLLALNLLTACSDNYDVIDYDPGYWGPTGNPSPPAGPDDDHCDGC